MIFAVMKQLKAKQFQRKPRGFNGIGTHDLRDIGVMIYQLSYEAAVAVAVAVAVVVVVVVAVIQQQLLYVAVAMVMVPSGGFFQ